MDKDNIANLIKGILAFILCEIITATISITGGQVIRRYYPEVFEMNTNNIVQSMHFQTIMLIIKIVLITVFIIWYIKMKKPEGKKYTLKQLCIPSISAGATISYVTMLIAMLVIIPIIIIGKIDIASNEVIKDVSETGKLLKANRDVVIGALDMILLAPISEELVMRGVLLGYLRKSKLPFIIANIIQSFAFGYLHGNIGQGIMAFFLGLMLGYIMKRYNNILAPILAHIANNTVASIEERNNMNTWIYMLIMISCIIIHIYTLRYIARQTKNVGEVIDQDIK